MVIKTFSCFLLFVFSCGISALPLVKKQVFEMQNFRTFNGNNIATVKVGWESYGKLNAAKSNVVLITHFFTGNSHAAGKYHTSDPKTGYWDELIGPSKAIDTDKFFVISIDTLVNLNAHDPMVTTTGPASINPATQKPYGLSFPVVTIRDFVNVQKAVLESLGITRLHAVVGPSMGSMQALDWALAYPDWVPRMISVIGTSHSDPWTVATLEQWSIAIKLDPLWQQGDYYQSAAPLNGLVAALMLVTQSARHPLHFKTIGESKQINFHNLEKGPLHNILADHSIVDWLKNKARDRAKMMDANHLLYLVRANQLFIAGFSHDLTASLRKIKAKSLFIPAKNDLLLMPYLANDLHETLLSLSKSSTLSALEGPNGHLDGLINIQQKTDVIRAFLRD